MKDYQQDYSELIQKVNKAFRVWEFIRILYLPFLIAGEETYNRREIYPIIVTYGIKYLDWEPLVIRGDGLYPIKRLSLVRN